MNKWTKVKCNLFWHLQEIDLRQKVEGDFQFSFARGDSKGESDLMKPDSQNKLIFDSHYEVPCTMYIDKTDGSVRPKKLKITLKRNVNSAKTKIFGKLTINVSDFYGKSGEISINKEMESGRGTPPVFIAKFQLQPLSDVVEAGKADMNDLSFLGEQDKHVPLKDWDVNDAQNQDDEEEEVSDEKKKPKKKKPGFRKSKKIDKKKSKTDKKTGLEKQSQALSDLAGFNSATENPDMQAVSKLVFEKEMKTTPNLVFTKESQTTKPETAPNISDENITEQNIENNPSVHEDVETSSNEGLLHQNKDETIQSKDANIQPKDANIQSKDETIQHEAEDESKKKKQKKKSTKTDDDSKSKKKGDQDSKKKTEKSKDNDSRKVQKSQDQELSSSADEDDDGTAIDTPEAKNERKKDEELMRASPEYFFHVILNQDWTHLKLCNPHFIKQSSLTLLIDNANKPCFPVAFFPLIATFCETHFLDDTEDNMHFQSELSVFVAEYPTLPNLTISARLQLTILLYAFVYNNINGDQPLFRYSKKKSELFLKNLLDILEKQCDNYLLKYMNRTEVLVNRFATANFEFDHLLADCRQVIRKANAAFDKFGSNGMNKIIKARYLDLFETKILNKIVESPNRFTFTNSAIWNSFISALENDERISLSHIKEAISALIMASSISASPELALEVCPNIPKRLVVFILDNYETDQNMSQKFDASAFMQHFAIRETPKGKPYDQVIQPLKLTYVEWSTICQECDFTKWNSLPKMDTTVNSYSFFGKYIPR